ncbi:MAG: threonine--tRNA ligase [Symbiobacteriaceae bacterium]|nr:threonine--tRNA ligase [Symbiobacteriaceae bacterium]
MMIQVQSGTSQEQLTWDSPIAREAYRHTCSHVLAQAVKRLYPEARLAIGPAIDTGFYYDFDVPESFTTEDLISLEEEMRGIIALDLPLQRFELPRDEAVLLMAQAGENYKVDLINDLPADTNLSFYRQGEYTDLCAGPHLMSTGRIGAFKLTHVAGAYWRGNEKNPMLQRIYGTAFDSEEELTAYLTALDEARKRDHRKLGRELDLFSIDEEVGPGLILWHPKLSTVREQIELYWRREHRRRGYEYVYTPHIGMSNLWETSGHLQTFADGMFPPMQMSVKDAGETSAYYIKPMNCPFHIQIYKSRQRSYRDLPLRWCELGGVYRYERSGTLHGMLRVRGFTQDDAHIICTEEQFEDEINRVLDFAFDLNRDFGFDQLKVYLSVRDLNNREDKYVGESHIWDRAEETLERLLIARGIAVIRDVGGAKFYGPAIDLKAVDAMGREWQGTTIQLDMNEPLRFGMTYTGSDGQEHTPIMLHRTLLGAMERFVGVLIEQYAGAFPTWLAPVQASILTITNRADNRAKEILAKLLDLEIRAETDLRNEKIGYKIREAQVSKVPYMLILGDREVAEGLVSVRGRLGDLGQMTVDDFISKITEEITTRALHS